MRRKSVVLLCLIMVMSMCAVTFTGCGDTTNGTDNNDNGQQDALSAEPENTANGTSGSAAQDDTSNADLLTGKHHVEIDVKDYGVIKVELDADTAPISVTNFVDLAKSGFYDGLTFHRIISGFMIQGGDPEGTGMGGSDKTIKGEFSANGVKNDISHVRGTISMARSNDMDSASSQFFIVHEDSTFLDGQYAGFGKVTEGMDIVDKICDDTKVQDDNGTVDKADQPIINSIKVID